MTKDKQPRIKGRLSHVLAGKTKGGTLVIRIDKDLHQQLAKKCKSRNVSMNRFVERLIEESLEGEPCPRS